MAIGKPGRQLFWAVALLLIVGAGAALLALLLSEPEGPTPPRPQGRLISPDQSLQDELDRAEAGTVLELVADATYRGPLVIRTPGLMLRSRGGRAVIAAQEGDVVRVEASDVQIEGLEVRGGERGIVISGADGVRLLDNLIVDSEIGIEAIQAQGILLQGNEVRGTRFVGITLSRAVSSSEVVGNRLRQSCCIGIRVANSADNLIEANIIEDNPDADVGIEVSLGSGNHLVGNRVISAAPDPRRRFLGIILQSTQENVLEGNVIQGAQLALQEERSRGNVIRGNTIESAVLGMRINLSRGTEIESNTMRDVVQAGIYLLQVEEATLRANVVERAGQFGLQIEFVNRAEITGNTVTQSAVGIMAAFAQGSLLAENVLQGNGWGMAVLRSGGNTISGNRAQGNAHSGMSLLLSSTGNTLTDNDLRANGIGLRLILSPDNRVERNLFTDNKVGVALSHSGGGTLITHNTAHSNDIGVLVEVLSEIPDEETVLSQFRPPLHLPEEGDNEGYRIEENNLISNRQFGLKNMDLKITVPATSNWWGDPSGPGGAGPGKGDHVSSNVSFAPWLEEEVTGMPSPPNDETE